MEESFPGYLTEAHVNKELENWIAGGKDEEWISSGNWGEILAHCSQSWGSR